jgi:hypothetical protein
MKLTESDQQYGSNKNPVHTICNQLVAQCFLFFYTKLLHVFAIYPGRLQGVISLVAVYSIHGTVQFPYLDTWKVFKECGEGGVGIRLASVCDSANTTSSKTLVTYIRVTVPAPNVAASVFGTGIVC